MNRLEECPFCHRLHEYAEQINCKCGAYAHLMTIHSTPSHTSLFWSNPTYDLRTSQITKLIDGVRGFMTEVMGILPHNEEVAELEQSEFINYTMVKKVVRTESTGSLYFAKNPICNFLIQIAGLFKIDLRENKHLTDRMDYELGRWLNSRIIMQAEEALYKASLKD